MGEVRDDIINALEAEREKAAEYVEFKVVSRKQHGNEWSVVVEPLKDGDRIDESLESSHAWWAEALGTTGAADVFSVSVDERRIGLRFATGRPPESGRIRFYPPRYLDALYQIWSSPITGSAAERRLDELKEYPEEAAFAPLDGAAFPNLRRAQREALRLPAYHASYLQGPPGTGKTHTVGCIVAQLLRHRHDDKILLLATTNTAADQALVAVDRALESSGASKDLRRKCKRFGGHFIASMYEGREHLLTNSDPELLRAMMLLERSRPSPNEVSARAAWQKQIDALRAKMRASIDETLKDARLAVFTTTHATFIYESLRGMKPFAFIVIDEASQASIAHAAALATLGKNVLFAGDPRQLSPIAQSKNPHAAKWLGRSMFESMNRSAPNAVALDEQSRMAAPICKVVSDVFYPDLKLIVAKREQSDPKWLDARRLPNRPPRMAQHVWIERIEDGASFSPAMKSPIRNASARALAAIAKETAETGVSEQDILVLTPFRAQMFKLRDELRTLGLKGVSVSTVHKAQGRERHTVLFDPVDATHQFLKGGEAERIINVALSRAQARLVVALSASDETNPIFAKVAKVARGGSPVSATANGSDALFTLADLLDVEGFPHSVKNAVVEVNQRHWRFQGIQPHTKKAELVDLQTGKTSLFDTATVRSAAQQTLQVQVHESPDETWFGALTRRFFGASVYHRVLGSVPGVLEQADRLKRMVKGSNLTAVRGYSGELDTALALHKRGVRIHVVSADVRNARGEKFTDIDVLTKKGSLVEVRNWSKPLPYGEMVTKAQRLIGLKRANIIVDGVAINSLYVYAPGRGISQNAAEHLRRVGITPLTSEADLAQVL
jgi:hypothetical protein